MDVSESVDIDRSFCSSGGEACFRLKRLNLPELVSAADEDLAVVGVAAPSVDRDVTQRWGSRKM